MSTSVTSLGPEKLDKQLESKMSTHTTVTPTHQPRQLCFVTTNGPDFVKDADVRKRIRSQAARESSRPVREAGARKRMADKNKAQVGIYWPEPQLINNRGGRLPPSPVSLIKYEKQYNIKANGDVSRPKKRQSCTGCPFCVYLKMVTDRSPFSLLGGDLDPFLTLPASSHHRISTARLLYYANTTQRSYRTWIGLIDVTPICYRKYASSYMISGPQSLVFVDRLSVLVISLVSSLHMDLMRGSHPESLATTTTITDVMAMVNEIMVDPLSQACDLNILVITSLLCCEIILANRPRLELHINGLAQMMHQRGRLKAFIGMGHHWALARIAIASTLFACFLYEIEVPAIYSNFSAVETSIYELHPLIDLESPLFSSANGYMHLAPGKMRSRSTFDILDDMHRLTRKVLDISGDRMSSRQIMSANMRAMGKEAERALKTLESLPSAAEPDSTVVGDWVYESVRLAALIYATALLYRIPLSAIASHLHDRRTGMKGRKLTRNLSQACCKTGGPVEWRFMPGVFLWVTLVGAAAAQPGSNEISRSPARDDADDEGFCEGASTSESDSDSDMDWIEEDTITRRWLTMNATGYINLECTEHVSALNLTLAAMIKVRSFLSMSEALLV
ncbi:hypothetical protein EV356DRAFT_309209 [Viridothelium virens]|uniref:Transcription factor domain-containing protein n=1 Tax=Viridothelium virens TaxID=1048519 RepID=A0A6A6HKN5_VIRVR|nr:hypothetical protein EV356DRAFT_309209 [Viridothelium virens]